MDNNREPIYLFRLSDQKLILVTGVKNGYDEDSMKIYLGTPRRLNKLKIIKLARYFDGGTTIIQTEIGVFYSPTPLKKADTTWKPGQLYDIPLKKLDPEKYDIVEQFDRAIVTKKKKQ